MTSEERNEVLEQAAKLDIPVRDNPPLAPGHTGGYAMGWIDGFQSALAKYRHAIRDLKEKSL